MPTHSRNVNVAKAGIDRAMARRVIGVTVELHEELTVRTPVDTGYARASWVPGLQRERRSKAGEPTTKSARKAARGGAQARAQIGLATVISGYRDLRQGAVWVVNNTRYIRALNQRHRRAAGFIERAINAALLKASAARFRGR